MPAPNIIISLDTEFIENENENVIKNDCEINSAKRLLERLKKDYPKLPVCIQGDALYAAKTAGRGRWKIENEGFNNRKNGIYDIVHLNSRNSNAMKNHYLITQIADIIMQLYLAWSPLIKKVKQSKKNTSSRLLESFRIQPITDEDVKYIYRYTTVYLE